MIDLDELGTMSMRLQEKLLRLVEYGEFERLGGQKTLQVDVRVVAATNADLPSLADAGTFRADLLDRLSFDVVHIPPLRHRREDIAELADHFAVQMSVELGWEVFPGFTADALATLQEHDWPGNIRELKNVVERSLHRWGDSSMPVGEIIVDPFSKPWQDRPVTEQQRIPAAKEAESAPALSDFGAHMDALEKQLLRDALARHDFHQRRTADALGLSYDQMRGLVRKHKLSRRQRRS